MKRLSYTTSITHRESALFEVRTENNVLHKRFILRKFWNVSIAGFVEIILMQDSRTVRPTYEQSNMCLHAGNYSTTHEILKQ